MVKTDDKIDLYLNNKGKNILYKEKSHRICMDEIIDILLSFRPK